MGLRSGHREEEKQSDCTHLQRIEIVAYQAAAMRLQTVPNYQQRLLEMGFECVEKFDDLFLLDTALVQAEQTVGARESGNHRDVSPVGVKLDDGNATLGRLSAYARGALADT
jgi:hypothetical protein